MTIYIYPLRIFIFFTKGCFLLEVRITQTSEDPAMGSRRRAGGPGYVVGQVDRVMSLGRWASSCLVGNREAK